MCMENSFISPARVINQQNSFFAVQDVTLSNSSLPYKGILQITTSSAKKNVCWKSLDGAAKRIVCRQLGYLFRASAFNISVPTHVRDPYFSGSIQCARKEKYLSQCSVNASGQRCSELTYIQCLGKKNVRKVKLKQKYYMRKPKRNGEVIQCKKSRNDFFDFRPNLHILH